MGSAANQSAPLLGSPLPSPWASPLSPAVVQYSCSAADPCVSWLIPLSPSTLVLPPGAAVACSSTNWKTCIDGALALLGDVRAMVEKMAVVEEAKKAAPPDVLSPSPPADGNAFHHPLCHLQIVWSSSESVGSALGEELWWLGSPPKALRCRTTGPHRQGDPRPWEWQRSPRAPSSHSAVGAPALRRYNHFTFSGGTKMSRRVTLERVPHLAVSSRASLGHPSQAPT
jgi:hypothetical protein